MAWYIDTTRIFVQGNDEEVGQVIARLQPVASGTVLQVFGYEKPTVKLKGIIVGSGDKASLKGYGIDATTHTVSGPYGARDFYVSSVRINQIMAIKQTVRTDLAENAPVYNFEMELYE